MTTQTPKESAQHSMLVLDRSGHSPHEWDPDDPIATEAMRQLFDNLVRERHYLAFRMGEGGRRGEQIREFDPAAGRILIAPPMQGGASH